MIDRMTGALEFHSRALALRAERQRVIAGNIANADTPGYQARDFDFASALRAATSTLPGAASPGIARDVLPGSVRGAPVALRYALPGQTSADSNTVDMDRERGAFIDNSVKYEAALRFINGNVRTLTEAMRSQSQG